MDMPKICPACGSQMHVRSLRCPGCATEVQGDYPLGRFAALSGEHLTFLETFIRCRGSLKDVGAALEISYPTARNRLDALIAALGFESRPEPEQRMEILQQLKAGSLTVEQALAQLEGEKRYE